MNKNFLIYSGTFFILKILQDIGCTYWVTGGAPTLSEDPEVQLVPPTKCKDNLLPAQLTTAFTPVQSSSQFEPISEGWSLAGSQSSTCISPTTSSDLNPPLPPAQVKSKRRQLVGTSESCDLRRPRSPTPAPLLTSNVSEMNLLRVFTGTRKSSFTPIREVQQIVQQGERNARQIEETAQQTRQLAEWGNRIICQLKKAGSLPMQGQLEGFPQEGTSVDPVEGFPQEGTSVDPVEGFPQEGTSVDPVEGFPQEGTSVDPVEGFPQEGTSVDLVEPGTAH